MAEKGSNLLAMCCDCKKIALGPEDNRLWVEKEEHPKLYKDLIENYEGNVTHGYCPSCYNKNLVKYNLEKKEACLTK